MHDTLRLRNATRRGGVLPPRTPPRRGTSASSASRRHEDAVRDRLARRGYVQLAPGVIVVWQRQPYRVVAVEERPLDLWDERYEKRFAADIERWERTRFGDKPERATWWGRPFAVQLVPATDPEADPEHLIGPASHSWTVLPEHYAVCVACGELPPCRHELAEREADRQAARADVLLDIPAGHCLGCGEFVTARQQAARFPGPNLWRPDLPDHSAVFHARQDCATAVDRYRSQWEARRVQADGQLHIADDDEEIA